MIIFLYGADNYRKKQKLNELRAGYQAKNTAVLESSFDVENEDDFVKLKSFLGSPSLFHPFRMAIIHNVFAYEKEREIISLLATIIEDKSIVCAISEERVPRKAFAFLLEKPVLSQQFKPFTPREFQAWLTEEAKKRNVVLNTDEMRYFTLNYSADLWGASTELDAFALRKKKEKISHEHDLMRADFFSLVSSLHPRGNPRSALPILEILLEKEDSARVFNFLAYRAQGNEKVRFADYDVMVKSGKLDYDTALLDVMLPN